MNQAHAFEILNQPPLIDIEEVEDLSKEAMSNEHFINAYQAMNLVQREIFVNITRNMQEQMNGSDHRERFFVTSEADTGKTFMFNILKNQEAMEKMQ